MAPRRWPRSSRRRARRDSRPVWIAVVVVGLVVAAGGVLVHLTPEGRWLSPMTAGEAFTVPDRRPLSGPLVVYGTPPREWEPGLDDMGCEVTAGGGPVVLADSVAENRLVVDGSGVLPLVTFPGRTGHSLVCAGPGAQASAPLYVGPGHTSRHLVPLAAWCLAALLLPVGVVGLLSERAKLR